MELHDYLGSGLRIVESYEKRSRTILKLINDAAAIVEKYSSEQDSMLQSLRETLAKRKNLRKKDFDKHIECILERREGKKSLLRKALDALWTEEGEMVSRLRDIFTKCRPEDLEFIKNVMLPRMKGIEETVARLLMELQIEQAELTAQIDWLLSKGVKIRIRDFKTSIKELDILQSEKRNSPTKIIEEFEKVRLDILGQWLNICCAYENIKHGSLRGTGA